MGSIKTLIFGVPVRHLVIYGHDLSKLTLDHQRLQCLSISMPYRTFLNIPINTNKKKEYIGRKLVGYSMDQMFTVVADVENYNKFVPFCKKSDIISKKPEFLRASLEIGFPPIKESYTSRVTMKRPHLVQAICSDGKLFDHLETLWRFTPGLKINQQSCIIDFYVSFEFKSILHSQLAHIFFDQLVEQMENAFITEARKRYGRPSTKSVNLEVIPTDD